MSTILRQLLPSIVIVLALVGLSILARDVRGVYLAVAIAVVRAASWTRDRHGVGNGDALLRSPSPVNAAAHHRPGTSSNAFEIAFGIVAVLTMVVVGLVGWLDRHSIITALGGAVIAGAVVLLLLALGSGLAGVVMLLRERPQRPD